YMADYLRQLNVLGGRAALGARSTAVTAWNHKVQERMKRTVWNTGGCTSWYLDEAGRNTTVWPGTTGEFRRQTRSVDLAEYDVIRAAVQPGGGVHVPAQPGRTDRETVTAGESPAAGESVVEEAAR
ncbi:cyclohexanone monooxygenase, partial [Streptomyces sp. NPDC057705]